MKYINILLLCLSFQSCAQNNQNKETNMAQLTTEINSKVKYQDEGYLYNLSYEHTHCSFEILVNDMPVVTHFVPNNMYLSVNINKFLLKPGKQAITIRLYPQKISNTQFSGSLTSNSYVKINITKEWFTADSRASDKYAEGVLKKMENNLSEIPQEYLSKWNILTYETPKIEKDLPYAEFKTSIELKPEDINWQLTGWTNGQDLRNDPTIKQEVYSFYDKFIKIIEEKNTYEYIALSQQNIQEDAQSQPWEKEGVTDLIESYTKALEMEQEKLFIPKEKTELKFYGDGKVVTLLSTDPRFFGYPPLMSQGKEDKYVSAFILLLYKPKGSDQLKIIR